MIYKIKNKREFLLLVQDKSLKYVWAKSENDLPYPPYSISEKNALFNAFDEHWYDYHNVNGYNLYVFGISAHQLMSLQ